MNAYCKIHGIEYIEEPADGEFVCTAVVWREIARMSLHGPPEDMECWEKHPDQLVVEEDA